MPGEGPAARPSYRHSGLFIGVDAGGSHTEAVVVSADLRVLARARGRAGALSPDNAPQVAGTIAEVAREALQQTGASQVEALAVGATGAGRARERTALEEALRAERVGSRVR